MPQPQQPADRRRHVLGGSARRRFTDLVEDVAAWVLASAVAFLLVAAVLGGFAVHTGTAERSRVERATFTEVDAVLIENTAMVRGVEGAAAVRVEARWTDPDGTAHTGPVPATSPAKAGSTVRIWLDGDGHPVPALFGGAEAVFAGIAVGVGVLLAGGSVLGVCWIGVRRLTGRVNSAHWEREWARVGPEWSRDVR
jgi:hypothetical protein